MNELQIFNNPEFGQVRMIEIENKPYAVGIDVTKVLEYANPSKAVIQHCKGITKLGIPSDGGIQETNVIPEGDIYRLIVKAADQSKNPIIKEKAERFEHWIFDEVIPSIRKTGQYGTPEFLGKMHDSMLKIRALGWHATPTEKKRYMAGNLAKIRNYYYYLIDSDTADQPDPFGVFVEECCAFNKEAVIDRSTLHYAYLRWCYPNNVKPKSKIKLTEFLEQFDEVTYFRTDSKHFLRQRFTGIELKESAKLLR